MGFFEGNRVLGAHCLLLDDEDLEVLTGHDVHAAVCVTGKMNRGHGIADLPRLLDAGVNVQFPIEIGTWKADPMALRKRFGKELRVIGGIDKLELEKGRAAIDAEIERRVPLMREGGFVPMPDHLITPGVPLDDYRYYIEQMRGLRF